ncbi:hypothetical protein TNCV_977881 [Trichonephila clavipes]|nr:hypothetical protein TNCV_977881 [Trichonephila clavipes]
MSKMASALAFGPRCKHFRNGQVFELFACRHDPCDPNPCENNGVCKIVGEERKCKCLVPFSGEYCENDDNNSTVSLDTVETTSTTPVTEPENVSLLTTSRDNEKTTVDFKTKGELFR